MDKTLEKIIGDKKVIRDKHGEKAIKRECNICGEKYVASIYKLKMNKAITCSPKCGSVIAAQRRTGIYEKIQQRKKQ